MLGSLVSNRFDAFGPSQFLPGKPPRMASLAIDGDAKSVRRQLRALCPRSPGIYGMIDAEGQLIYVGKSKSLLSRLVTYFQKNDEADKCRRIIARTVKLVWEELPHEFVALARELELIVRWRPRFNVQGQPGRTRQVWLSIRRSSAPSIEVSTRPVAGRSLIGPLTSRGQLREAVRVLNDHFGLRDCPSSTPMHFVDQGTLFSLEPTAGCLRAELETCLTPCAAGCTRREYAAQVRQAESFLRGDNRTLLAELESAMQRAASEHHFEKAATLRDKWTALSNLASRIDRLAEVRRSYNFIYPLQDGTPRDLWYVHHQGQLIGAARAPGSAASAGRVLKLLQQCDSHGNLDRRTTAATVAMTCLVSAWFHTHPAELQKTIPLPKAVTICQGLMTESNVAVGA